jgi:hypothetical protein
MLTQTGGLDGLPAPTLPALTPVMTVRRKVAAFHDGRVLPEKPGSQGDAREGDPAAPNNIKGDVK